MIIGLDMTEKTQVKIKLEYSDEFRREYSNGAMGGFNGFDFRITFFRDELKMKEKANEAPTIIRKMHSEVILTPLALKQLNDWLTKHIQDLEKIMGEIKPPAQITEAGVTTNVTKPYG